jgi:hypothetical protein
VDLGSAENLGGSACPPLAVLRLYEWLSLVQWAVMGVTSILLWRMRSSVKDAVEQADHERRIRSTEIEIERLREWRHKDVVNWQQTLMDRLDERFLTRREFQSVNGNDSPWPSNERRKRTR